MDMTPTMPNTTSRRAGPVHLALTALLLCWSAAALSDMATAIDAFQRMDYTAAIEQMEVLADENEAANYYLGVMRDPAYHRLPSGKFYQMAFFDVSRAIENYETAIAAGDPYSMHRLAELYLLMSNRNLIDQVEDVGNLTSSAVQLRRQSAPQLREQMEQGNGIAAYLLAEARRDEPFFFIAMEQARTMLEVSARNGDSNAQLYLGKTYLFPRGTVVGAEGFTFDPVEAFAWFTIASKAHNHHGSVYQVEAAEAMPIRDYQRAEDKARALLSSIVKDDSSTEANGGQ